MITNPSPVISIVIPVYYGEPTIEELTRRITKSVTRHTFEIIFVDDCSPDDSWNIIRKLCSKHNNIKGLRLARNFGQHIAITAGLQRSCGQWVIIMDCDLQDLPEEIPVLLKKAYNGFDIVQARRANRNDNLAKQYSSKIFYFLFKFLTGIQHNHEIANFGVYHRKVVDAVVSLGDQIRFTPALMSWVGFKKCSIEVKHSERQAGESTYTIWKLVHLAGKSIIAFSNRPLKSMVIIGVTLAVIALLMSAYHLISYFTGAIVVPGYASLIVSIWFLSGVIIASLGIVGIYIGEIFNNTKNRPLYIIDETLNDKL